MAKRYEAVVIGATRGIVVPSGTAQAVPGAAGIHANGNGVVEIQWSGNPTLQNLNIASGMTYPYRIVAVGANSTVEVVVLFNE